MSSYDCADILYAQIKMLKLPLPIREFKFYEQYGRKWRADIAWPELKILVECDGGNWKNGRHVRPKGFEKDCIKINHATMAGYQVYRFTKDMILRAEAINFIEKILGEQL